MIQPHFVVNGVRAVSRKGHLSIEALNWAWKQDIDPKSKIILLALADHADDQGVCWPSLRHLGRKCGMSKSSVARMLFALAGPKALMIEIPRKREDGGNSSKMYRLNLKDVPLWANEEQVKQVLSGDFSFMRPPVPPRRDTLSHHSGTPCPVAVSGAEEPSVKHHLTKPAQAQFDEFWKAYPKKRSKGTALRVWKKLKPDDALLTSILESLARATKSTEWAKDGGMFVPYPATWLNARGWEDEYEPVGGRPARAVLPEFVIPESNVEVRKENLAKLKRALC